MKNNYYNKQKKMGRENYDDKNVKLEVSMKVKEVTVTAEASLAYQKYCASITAEDVYTEEDFNSLREWAIYQAKAGIKELTDSVREISYEQESQADMIRTDKSKVSAPVTPCPRTVVNQPSIPQNQPRPQMNAKVAEDYQVGDLEVFDGVEYRLCKNKNSGQLFWGITKPDLISDKHPKFHRQGLE